MYVFILKNYFYVIFILILRTYVRIRTIWEGPLTMYLMFFYYVLLYKRFSIDSSSEFTIPICVICVIFTLTYDNLIYIRNMEAYRKYSIISCPQNKNSTIFSSVDPEVHTFLYYCIL